jgi:hypothetical protein
VDDRAAEIEAVMDAVGFGKAVLLALSEGGPAATDTVDPARGGPSGPGPAADRR